MVPVSPCLGVEVVVIGNWAGLGWAGLSGPLPWSQFLFEIQGQV